MRVQITIAYQSTGVVITKVGEIRGRIVVAVTKVVVRVIVLRVIVLRVGGHHVGRVHRAQASGRGGGLVHGGHGTGGGRPTMVRIHIVRLH